MELSVGPDHKSPFGFHAVAFESLENGVGTHRAAEENRAITIEFELIRHLNKIFGQPGNRKTRRSH